jgi:hypothetical protein
MQPASGGLGRPSILNALHVGAASQDRPRVEFGRRPTQAADQANLATDPDSAKRARDFSTCVPCTSHERTARDFEGQG